MHLENQAMILFMTIFLFFPFENHNSEDKLLDMTGQKEETDKDLQFKSKTSEFWSAFLPISIEHL